jgi:hypothetical protein
MTNAAKSFKTFAYEQLYTILVGELFNIVKVLNRGDRESNAQRGDIWFKRKEKQPITGDDSFSLLCFLSIFFFQPFAFISLLFS